jgi:hypothetical protein
MRKKEKNVDLRLVKEKWDRKLWEKTLNPKQNFPPSTKHFK